MPERNTLKQGYYLKIDPYVAERLRDAEDQLNEGLIGLNEFSHSVGRIMAEDIASEELDITFVWQGLGEINTRR